MLSYIKAFEIMLKAHMGQKDKAGKPYFLHPLRVSLKLKNKKAMVVALLHDVLEDSDKYVIDDFYFLDNEQKDALSLLTHKDDDYFDYIDNIKKNNLATQVKLKDLEDNMNLKRIKFITPNDIQRTHKYNKAKKILENIGK